MALPSARLLIWIQRKKYHKTAGTSLPEDEHLDVSKHVDNTIIKLKH